MTSTPASRSARATTFAPRSWPSRPGLAMTTRMLLMNPSTGTRPGTAAGLTALLGRVAARRAAPVPAGRYGARHGAFGPGRGGRGLGGGHRRRRPAAGADAPRLGGLGD